jgi:hypothetical protein
MSARERFEAWWPSLGQTIGKVAAWAAWQAARAAALEEAAEVDVYGRYYECSADALDAMRDAIRALKDKEPA